MIQQPQLLGSQVAGMPLSARGSGVGPTILRSGVGTTATVVQQGTVGMKQMTYVKQVQQPDPVEIVKSATEGQATRAVETAHTMFGEIRMMEETIIDLQRENEMLKQRIITERRGSLEKFFAVDARLLMQETLKQWAEYTEELRSLRALELATSSQQQEALEHDKIMGQMNREADGLAKALEDVQGEDKDTFNNLVEKEAALNAAEQEQQALLERIKGLNEELRRKREEEGECKSSTGGILKQLQKAEKIVKLVNEVSTSYEREEDQPDGVIRVEQKMKAQLHNVLRDTDQNYVPPLDKLATFGSPSEKIAQKMATPVVRQRSILVQGQVMVPTATPTQVLRAQSPASRTIARELPM